MSPSGSTDDHVVAPHQPVQPIYRKAFTLLVLFQACSPWRQRGRVGGEPGSGDGR